MRRGLEPVTHLMADSPPTPPSGRTIDFERGVPFLVSALGNKLSAIASRSVRRELGVGLMEWRILALLAVEAEATPTRIGQVAGVDKSVVSRAASTLEQRGLVAIAPGGPGGRQTRVTLTADGRALHARGVEVAYLRNEDLLHGFSPKDRAQLAELLRRATDNLPRLEPKRRGR